jgi:hypothetical protein
MHLAERDAYIKGMPDDPPVRRAFFCDRDFSQQRPVGAEAPTLRCWVSVLAPCRFGKLYEYRCSPVFVADYAGTYNDWVAHGRELSAERMRGVEI